jgi:hypothetical protein
MLVVDIVLDFLCTLVIGAHLLEIKSLSDFTINFLFKLAELVFPVLFFLIKKASFPLPEGLDAVLLAFNLVFVALEFALSISNKLNCCNFCLVDATTADFLNASETSWQFSKAGSNLREEVNSSLLSL